MRFPRLLKLPKQQHLFLFGARNTGKSTLIKESYPLDKTLLIDLLDDDEEQRFTRHTSALTDIVAALSDQISYVVIDEVQKVPKL